MKETDGSDTSATPRAGGDALCKGIGIAETVVTTAAIVSAAGGLKFVLEMARLWIEARKDRRIKIKKGDVEIELQGTMSDKDITAKIELFERLARKETDKEIKILIP